MALLSALATVIWIPVCAVIGIVFCLVLWWLKSCNSEKRDHKKSDGDHTHREAVKKKHDDITRVVFQGVKKFRSTGYLYGGVFTVAFAVLIFLLLGSLESFSTQSRPCKSDPSKKCKPALATAFFTAVSILLGAFTPVLSAFLRTEIAIRAIARTALEERSLDGRNAIAGSTNGAVMGLLPDVIDLLGLFIVIIVLMWYYGNDWEGLFEATTGYDLGKSFMALFGRACGGIFAKAADVSCHLVRETKPWSSKTEQNPAVITNYVGVIVGDIAGEGPDSFGSYAVSSCTALVVASASSFGIKRDFTAMCYPLLIRSMGILVLIFVCLISNLMEKIPILGKKIELASKKAQLITFRILMTAGSVVVSLIALPPLFTVYKIESPGVVTERFVKNWQVSLLVAVGLWAGPIIEFVTSYCNRIFSFLPDVDASNVGVSLGSVPIPFVAAVGIIVISHYAGTYGIAVAVLGMQSINSTRLAIEASGRICDNAERIAHMAREGACDTDDNPTADITEGFSIELNALLFIALLGAFVSRPAILSPADVLTPKGIIGLIMGARLPSYFSSMIMKRVGRAAFEMTHKQIGVDKRLINERCFEIATNASFNGMIGPGALVMSAPFIVGTVFGVETLSGLLAGTFASVVQIAISPSKADGARKQAKEDIRAGALKYANTLTPGSDKERRLLRLAEEGKTTGYSRKDTSGPALFILVLLMVVESLVLAPWFASHGGLLFKII